jgi:sterol 14-demethylase
LAINEITGIMMAVLLGGQHTSNVTGAWLMMHLLNEPKWLKAVLDEQVSVIGKDFKGHATFDQVRLFGVQKCCSWFPKIGEMHVLQRCLDETLRLHPPFFQVARRVQNDVEYKGVCIPKGRLVCISPGAVMRLETMFERPHEFDPSRFEKVVFLCFPPCCLFYVRIGKRLPHSLLHSVWRRKTHLHWQKICSYGNQNRDELAAEKL